MYTLTPITGVNVRSGPGMEYDIAYRLPPKQAVEWFETKRDSVNKLWYKTVLGWVCGDYVTLAEDAQGEIMRLTLFSGDGNDSQVYQMTKSAGDTVGKAGSIAWNMTNEAGEYVKTTTQPAISTAKAAINKGATAGLEAAGYVAEKGKSAADYLGETYDGVSNTLKNGAAAASDAWQGIVDSDAGQKVSGAWSDVKEVGKGIVSGTIQTADSVINGVSGLLDGGGAIGGSKSDNMLKRRIFGVPYQFLSTTDARAEGTTDGELGVTYKQMMLESPRLMVIPGRPMFLPDMSTDQRKAYLTAMGDFIEEMTNDGVVKEFMQSEEFGNIETKFFSFKQDFAMFSRYLNAMCWTTAVMMGIGNDPVPGALDESETFAKFDWAGFTLAHIMANRNGNPGAFGFDDVEAKANQTMEEAKNVAEGFWTDIVEAYNKMIHGQKGQEGSAGFQAVMSAFSIEKYYTEFYIDPSVSFSESHTNNLRPSMLAEIANKGSDLMNEFQFFMDTTRLTSEIAGNREAFQKTVHDMVGGIGGAANQFINRFLTGASSVFSGAVLQFPEIWSGYNFSRDYTIEINLKAAYGEKHCIFIDEFVPMWFWNCLTMPRQHSPNSYRSPFLVRCNIPGIVNTDMGVVTSLTRTIGDGSARTIDGYPLEMKLSIRITDLISEISISRINSVSFEDAYNFLWNTALMDYIASLSACDFRQSDYTKKAAVAKALANNAMKGIFEHPVDRLEEVVRETIYNIFH